MATETILFGREAREAIKQGVDMVCNPVKETLGAAGRNVVISYPFGQQSTKDGVSVARSIQLVDPVQRAGAEIIKEVAMKMLTEVGDSTTTACVLAQAIIAEGMRLVNKGANPIELKKGIDAAVKEVVEILKEVSIPCDTYEKMLQVATVSANQDKEIGKLIADAFIKVGGDGVVLIEDALSPATSIKFVDGLQFDKGYGVAEFYVTDRAKMIAEMKDSKVLIYDGAINTMQQLSPIMQMVLSKPGGKLFIIANSIDDEAYAFLGVNRSQSQIPVIMVESPLFGDYRTDVLEDIATLTNGQVVSEAKGFKLETITAHPEVLGTCGRVTVSKTSTTIVNGGGKSEDIETRIEEIRTILEATAEEEGKGFLRRRIAKLKGSVAILSVGAPSEVALREKKDRCDDAIRATKSAIEEGIVPGGGSVFMWAQRLLSAGEPFELDAKDETSIFGWIWMFIISIFCKKINKITDFKKGQRLIHDILAAPFFQICKNAGVDPNSAKRAVHASGYAYAGYNVKSEKVEDLVASGIIDPTKAARCAIQFSSDIAGLLLITETLLINVMDSQQPGM